MAFAHYGSLNITRYYGVWCKSWFMPVSLNCGSFPSEGLLLPACLVCVVYDVKILLSIKISMGTPPRCRTVLKEPDLCSLLCDNPPIYIKLARAHHRAAEQFCRSRTFVLHDEAILLSASHLGRADMEALHGYHFDNYKPPLLLPPPIVSRLRRGGRDKK